MKIVINDSVYVQKNDIAYLNQTNLDIPASIFMKVFGSGITIIDDSNRFEFIKFEEEHEIEYFKNLDWIVDYNSVKNLSVEEIIELGQSIAQEKNNIAEKFNAMSLNERKVNSHMIDECERLDFKMYSLRDIIWFKQGHIKMMIPDCVECLKEEPKKKAKGLRRFLNKFRRKNI